MDDEKMEKVFVTVVVTGLIAFACFVANIVHYDWTAKLVGHETRYCEIKKVTLESGKYPTIQLEVIDGEVEYNVDTNSRDIPVIDGLDAITIVDSWQYRDGVVKKKYYFYGYKDKK